MAWSMVWMIGRFVPMCRPNQAVAMGVGEMEVVGHLSSLIADKQDQDKSVSSAAIHEELVNDNERAARVLAQHGRHHKSICS